MRSMRVLTKSVGSHFVRRVCVGMKSVFRVVMVEHAGIATNLEFWYAKYPKYAGFDGKCLERVISYVEYALV